MFQLLPRPFERLLRASKTLNDFVYKRADHFRIRMKGAMIKIGFYMTADASIQIIRPFNKENFLPSSEAHFYRLFRFEWISIKTTSQKLRWNDILEKASHFRAFTEDVHIWMTKYYCELSELVSLKPSEITLWCEETFPIDVVHFPVCFLRTLMKTIDSRQCVGSK